MDDMKNQKAAQRGMLPQRRVQRILASCIVALFTVHSQAASVETLSNDILEHQGEDAYWQAMVKCEGSSTAIPIKQALKQQDWCSENSLLTCTPSKMQMAQQVCLNIDIFEESKRVTNSRPAAPPTNQTSPATTTANRPSIQTKPSTISQPQREQRARERARQAEIAAAILNEEQFLQEERRRLEQEKRALEQAEQKLSAQEQQLEAQLRRLEN